MRPLDVAGRVHQFMLEPVKNGCLQFILAEGGEVCTSALASAVAPKCFVEKFDEAGFNSSQPLQHRTYWAVRLREDSDTASI
jgi:hypothetical protein